MTDAADALDMYTELPQALLELKRRRADTALCEKVADFFSKLPPPAVLVGEPRAVLTRYIVSPTIEMARFCRTVQKSTLKPLFLEYAEDKFVARNFEKYCLGRLHFARDAENNKKGVTVLRIVNFNKNEGKILNRIATEQGGSLVDFHHRLLEKSDYVRSPEILDFSEWFKKSRKLSGDYYYLYYLALFLTNSILFENFLLDKREHDFTEHKVVPAFKRLEELFGIRPLVVPLAPPERATEPHWCYYEKRLQKFVEADV